MQDFQRRFFPKIRQAKGALGPLQLLVNDRRREPTRFVRKRRRGRSPTGGHGITRREEVTPIELIQIEYVLMAEKGEGEPLSLL